MQYQHMHLGPMQNLLSIGKIATIGKDVYHVGKDGYQLYKDIKGLQNLEHWQGQAKSQYREFTSHMGFTPILIIWWVVTWTSGFKT